MFCIFGHYNWWSSLFCPEKSSNQKRMFFCFYFTLCLEGNSTFKFCYPTLKICPTISTHRKIIPYMESGLLHLIQPHPRMTEWCWNDKNGSFLGHSWGNMPGWQSFHPCHSSIISTFGGHSHLEWPSNAKKSHSTVIPVT